VLKYATAEIIDAQVATRGSGLLRTAHRARFDFEPQEGYLYIRSRMISSRCNDNFDAFSAEAIRGDGVHTGWHTFIGKPVFVNHVNEDHRRARGVIIDAALHEDTLPSGKPDTWVEGLMQVDAVTFPKLAKAILAGHIDRTSMGVDVEHSICSVCANKATTPLEYCAHIPGQKGSTHYRVTASGQRVGKLIFEQCHGLRFFENSLLVEEPADPTAHFLGSVEVGPGLEHLAMARTASRQSATPARAVPRPAAPVTSSLSVVAHGGRCPACFGLNTIAVSGSAECGDCEHLYTAGLSTEAKPRHADPADHPFFQANPAHADNVLRTWHEGTEDEHESGHRWYADAGLVAKGLGTLHRGQHPGGNTHLAAGLIANYSPQTGWAANQHNAARVLHSGTGIGGPGSGIFASTQQKNAANRMLGGELHTSVLTSPKVSDFAHLVEHGGDADPDNPHVVVDRHALSVATGRRMSDADYTAFPKTNRHYYGHVVKAYHDAAQTLTDQTGRLHTGHALQAATWLTQQRKNQEGERAKAAETGKQNGFDKGREVGRQRQEKAWNEFRQQHLPHMDANPGTGYQASRRGR
jgi:hypothetical protein